MRLFPPILLLAATAWPGLVRGQQASGPDEAKAEREHQVEVAGLAVVRTALPADGDPGYKPFRLDRGTRLGLLFRRPEGDLVCFDDQVSRIASFADDRGTNLLELSHRLQKSGFVPYACGTTSDGGEAYVEIAGGMPPAAGSTRVRAVGVAAFRVASTQATAEGATVRPEKDATVVVGEDPRFEFRIDRWQSGGGESDGVRLSLAHTGDCRLFDSFVFVDGEGEVIPTRSAAVSRAGETGAQAATYFHFELESTPPQLGLRLTYWTDMEVLEIPFEVEAGLGGKKTP